MNRLLAIVLSLWVISFTSLSQSITQAEYFFDTDPGVGNGVPISVIPGDSVLHAFSISNIALSPGFHQLFIRAANAEGHWGHYESRSFYVKDSLPTTDPQLTTAEYFFDTDPGVGNGIPISVIPGDLVLHAFSISNIALSPGFHQLFVRVKDTESPWGLGEGRSFYVKNPHPDHPPQLTAAEYFFDMDPGLGSGTAFPGIIPGDSVQSDLDISLPAMTGGVHHIVLRVRDSSGTWSLYEAREFLFGVPTQASLVSPPDQSIHQPTTVVFVWLSALDQTNASYTTSRGDTQGPNNGHAMQTPGQGTPRKAPLQLDVGGTVDRYWFEVVSDTVTMADLLRDTTLADTTTTVGPFMNSTDYFWRLRANNENGWGAYSSWWKFTTIVTLPGQVQLISPTEGGLVGDSAVFVWLRSEPDVERYWFELATDSIFATSYMDSTLTDTTTFALFTSPGKYWWRVRSSNVAGWGDYSDPRSFSVVIVGISEESTIPTEFALAQNYPNPFNPTTTIRYEIPAETRVVLMVFNLLGQEVATLVDEVKEPGRYHVQWDAGGMGSGVYYYRLEAETFRETKKLILLR